MEQVWLPMDVERRMDLAPRQLKLAKNKNSMRVGDDGWQNGKGKIYLLCPFHHERTPSCVIYTGSKERGTTVGKQFHCFGCGVGGSIDKLMRQLSKPLQLPRPPSPEVEGDIPF